MGFFAEKFMNNISFQQFKELHIKGYTLDMVFLLEQIRNEIDINTDSARINSILSSIERKGLITAEYKITLEGEQLLNFVSISDGTLKLIKKKIENEFDRFWKIFPSTDTFEYKGVKFEGSRALKTNKDECKLKLKAILNEGEYSIDKIVAAVEYDVLAKKEASIKTRTNKLSYIQNSLTYLRQRSYEPFIELLSQGATIKQSPEINLTIDI